jgi:hypothetical protein
VHRICKTLVGASFYLFVGGYALPADNLNCAPPTKEFPSPTAPIANSWVRVNGHQRGEVCVEFPSTGSIMETRCYTSTRRQRPYYYQCELNVSCKTMGTFVSTQRRQSPSPGKDMICAAYQNQNGEIQTAGLRIALASARATRQPKRMQAPYGTTVRYCHGEYTTSGLMHHGCDEHPDYDVFEDCGSGGADPDRTGRHQCGNSNFGKGFPYGPTDDDACGYRWFTITCH